MAASDNSNTVANEAIQLVGDNQAPVTGLAPNFDDLPAGLALQRLYAPTVAAVARQWGWDMARNAVALTLTANTPALGYSFEYLYPSNGVELWQLMPPPPLADPNDPLPVNWNVGNTLVNGVQTKVIWTNLANAVCIYNNNPGEGLWDPIFHQSVVRLLASALAIALEGRPDTAEAMLSSFVSFEQLGEARPD